MNITKEIETKIDALFTSFDRPDSPGYAVGILCGGEFLYEKGFGHANLEHPSPITESTVFDVGSMAKMFTGMAIALLEQDGRLSIDDPLRAYLPEFPDYADGVTLANLIYHTSGIRNYTVLAYYMMGCHESDAVTREQVYDILLNLRSLSFAPAAKWEYSDSNYFLLAMIAERVTGQTLDDYARAAIFAPLGMMHSRFRERHADVIPNRALSYVRHPVQFCSPSEYRQAGRPSGAYQTLISNYEHVGAEGMYTTLADLAKWARNFTDNKLGKGGPALIERVLTPGQPRINEDIGYGFGINIGTHRGRAFYGHDGAIHGYTSTMLHFLEEDTTIICLANHDTVGAWECRERIIDLIFEDCAVRSAPPAVARRVVSATEIQAITGAYQDPGTAAIWEIANEDGRPVAGVNRTRHLELVAVDRLLFTTSDPSMDLELEFVLSEQGDVLKVLGSKAGVPFALEPFLERPLRADELAEYVGEYCCHELRTAFLVDIVGSDLRLRNRNRHFCSMDLVYHPTIKDSFVAYDPHPVVSQITFLREKNRVNAFVYRDYDGDRREDLVFLR